jgi:ubiquinone/menaquinone biosynthesis C-methylase UbiE
MFINSKSALRSLPSIRHFSFTPEVATIYGNIFPQHSHEAGPWKKMVAFTKKLNGNHNSSYILDLASGPGEPGLMIAKEIPQCNVLITDVTEDMIAKAKKRSENIPNVHCDLVDMQDLSKFKDNTFDVITCCYGFMFCENKQKAYDEAYRVLKPGGYILSSHWKHLTFYFLSRITMEAMFPGHIFNPSINPMSLSEPNLAARYMKNSKFNIISMETNEYPFDLGNKNEDMIFKTGIIPILPTIIDLETQDKLDVIQQGKNAFFEALNNSGNNISNQQIKCTKTSDGRYILENNIYELIIASK